MKWLGFRLVLLVLAQAFFSSTHASLDQENERQPGFISFHPFGDEIWQQQVIVGVSGRLDAIEIFYKNDAPWLGDTLAFTFFVNRGTGWQTDMDDYSTTVTANDTNVSIDVRAANLTFQAGERFVFGVSRAKGGTLCCNLLGTGNNYVGDLWSHYSNAVHVLPLDFAFRTYVTAVPEVSALNLMLIGLLPVGAVCYIRKVA